LICRLTCQGVPPFTSNIWSGVAPLKIQGFFFFLMVSSTKSSVCKRLFSQLTPCFIGSSFMLVLCIRDRVLSRSSSRSFNATLLGNYGQKVPYMVEGLLLRSKDYGSASGSMANIDTWEIPKESMEPRSLHMALLGVFG